MIATFYKNFSNKAGGKPVPSSPELPTFFRPVSDGFILDQGKQTQALLCSRP
jgi:hypothetical protein